MADLRSMQTELELQPQMEVTVHENACAMRSKLAS